MNFEKLAGQADGGQLAELSTGCASVRGERWGTAEPAGLSPLSGSDWGQGSCPRRAGVPQAVELGGCLDGGRGGKPSSAKNLSQ